MRAVGWRAAGSGRGGSSAGRQLLRLCRLVEIVVGPALVVRVIVRPASRRPAQQAVHAPPVGVGLVADRPRDFAVEFAAGRAYVAVAAERVRIENNSANASHTPA